MKNYLDLTGKVSLITGASSGIGAATAAVFADLGASVAIGYHHNREAAEHLRAQITESGGRAISVGADVCQADEIKSMVRQVNDELGPIDVLVNNAGSPIGRQRVLEITHESWEETMNLNLKSALLCSQAVAASMIERRTGAIVNVVSIAGRTGGGRGAGAYAVAKGGLITFTKTLAKEMAPHGVRVNAIAPGMIDTPFHDSYMTPEMRSKVVEGIPLGRFGTSEECAKVIAFLASDAASYIAGATIEVNGGKLML
jgi:3-oxoacyl-[acyl-carrier protein] reductase